MMPTSSPRKRPGRRTTHGLYALRRAHLDPLSPRYAAGRALAAWRSQLVADLGGELSVQQEKLVDLAARASLMLDTVDAWLFQQPSLVNKRRRVLLPVVKERQAVAEHLARLLERLGLERKKGPVLSLADRIQAEADRWDAAHAREGAPAQQDHARATDPGPGRGNGAGQAQDAPGSHAATPTDF